MFKARDISLAITTAVTALLTLAGAALALEQRLVAAGAARPRTGWSG